MKETKNKSQTQLKLRNYNIYVCYEITMRMYCYNIKGRYKVKDVQENDAFPG